MHTCIYRWLSKTATKLLTCSLWRLTRMTFVFCRINSLFKPNLMMAAHCHDDKHYRSLYPSVIADIEVWLKFLSSSTEPEEYQCIALHYSTYLECHFSEINPMMHLIWFESIYYEQRSLSSIRRVLCYIIQYIIIYSISIKRSSIELSIV